MAQNRDGRKDYSRKYDRLQTAVGDVGYKSAHVGAWLDIVFRKRNANIQMQPIIKSKSKQV
jgi:hypothetical protein